MSWVQLVIQILQLISAVAPLLEQLLVASAQFYSNSFPATASEPAVVTVGDKKQTQTTSFPGKAAAAIQAAMELVTWAENNPQSCIEYAKSTYGDIIDKEPSLGKMFYVRDILMKSQNIGVGPAMKLVHDAWAWLRVSQTSQATK
jgi:hypothetical protein